MPTVIYSESADQLREAIIRLIKWCETNKIALNQSKTKIIKFRRGGHLARDDHFHINGSPIEIVSQYDCLGVTMQTGLAFHKQIKRVCAKAVARIGTLPG